MRYLNITSWVLTALGVAVTMISMLMDADPLWLLGGILLLITGIVKIVMLMIWTRIARLGTDEHEPINAL